MRKHREKKPERMLTMDQQIRRRNFLSFTAFIGFGLAGFAGWRWLKNSAKEIPSSTAGAQQPMRRALNRTELAFRKFFSNNHLAREYPKERAAKQVRENGHVGLGGSVNVDDWRLNVHTANGSTLKISMEEIRKLPKTELVFDFKCVEGWDQVQHWGGVKMIDFADHFNLQKEAGMAYMALRTPDQHYYVGLDMESALHPQTILAYEMNDKPLSNGHGAPLRLIIPVKYGIKNLKRIGEISFSNERPPDYWAERGYDYYSGL